MSDEIRYVPVSCTPEDLEFIERRDASIDAVCNLFRARKELIEDQAHHVFHDVATSLVTFEMATIADAADRYFHHVLRPILDDIIEYLETLRHLGPLAELFLGKRKWSFVRLMDPARN